jgi:2-keto-4-pentenoate hydratase
VSALAAKLARARAEARALDLSEGVGQVGSIADAIACRMHWPRRPARSVPEKSRRSSPSSSAAIRPTGRSAGLLFAPFVHRAPARATLKGFVAPLMECEIAFLLGRDLPARMTPYARAEIAEAVEALVPAIEIADCRWPAEAPDLLKLADDMGNGAFVAGTPLRDWKSVDLKSREVVLTLNGQEAARGPYTKVLGDPLMGLVGLANAQPLPAGGLKGGQIVTTGACITPIVMKAGDYVADFGALGRVALTAG